MRWRWGVLAGAALMLLSLMPQLRLWYARGAEWQGQYAYNDIDEVAYAAYLNALIEGRPRRNDPYTGHDATSPESIFSVQFATPYTIALPARLFRLNAPQAMILLAALTGLATGLVLFWLIAALTGDARFAAAGAIIVVCCGTLACGQGALGYLRGFGPAYPFLPAFRRYVPAGAFPVFFAFVVFVWNLTRRHEDTEARRSFYKIPPVSLRPRASVLNSFLALACFAFLVFSYFYLWTTALAWLGCLAVLWLAARRESFKQLAVLGALAGAVLLPYAWLLAQRGEATDALQLLTRTHAPDLARLPELLGLLAFTLLLGGVWRRRIEWRAPLPLFTAALALTPFLTFNQQILTGRSLQPVHYEVFIGNYVAVLALILCLWQLRPARRTVLSLVLGVAAFGWGVYEANLTSAVLDEANRHRDRAQPMLRRVSEICRTGETVFTTDFIVADELPAAAPCGVLWARHLHIFTGADWQGSKERFYRQIYWLALDEDWLAAQLRARNFVAVYALFGWGRLSNRLVANPQPLTDEEITVEVARYAAFRQGFNQETAARLPLSYAITGANETFPARLEQFYQRDAGERLGEFILYRVTVPGSKFKVQSSKFKVQSSKFKVQSSPYVYLHAEFMPSLPPRKH